MTNAAKIAIGVIAVAAVALYFAKRAAAARPALAQPAPPPVKPTDPSTPAAGQRGGPAVPFLLSSDGTQALSVVYGGLVRPTNRFGQWDPAYLPTTQPAGILIDQGDGTFLAIMKGSATISGSALDAQGGSYPLSGTITVT